jgi:hypothetical protein
MVAVIETSWQDILDGKPFPESPARQLFTNPVISVAAQAKAALPEANGRVDRARDLVLGGLVSRNADGTFSVHSQSEHGKSYTITAEGCQCPDAEKAPHGRCKHIICTWLWRKARKVLEQQSGEAASTEPTSPVEVSGITTAHIPVQFLTEIHGKQFVQYAGLLAMAHERGLVNLSASFISVSSDLALAEATAEFADGKLFKECADATPGNVGPTVRAHYPRIAATRAKARCLRDALNISVCSLEEMET